MEVRIRRARRTDYERLMALTGWPRSGSAPRRSVRLFRNVVSDLSYDLYVAEEVGDIVGVVAVSYTRVLGLGGPRAMLEDVVVRSDRRGSGLGRKLVEFAVRRAAGKGARALDAHAPETEQEAFLEHVGFQPSGRWFRVPSPGDGMAGREENG